MPSNDSVLSSAPHGRRRPLLLEIVYRGLEQSDSIDDRVTQHAQRLAAVTPLIACRTLIQASAHHGHGKPFHVRLELVLPDGNLAIKHELGRSEAHADVFHALREAFQCARRRIEETAISPRSTDRRAGGGSS